MEFNVNSPVLFVIAGLIIAAVLAQSVYFLVKAWKRGLAIGMGKEKLRTHRASRPAVFTIAPAVAIVISVITLAKDLGVPLPWLRLSVVGVLSYETIAASNAESAMGLIFGQVYRPHRLAVCHHRLGHDHQHHGGHLAGGRSSARSLQTGMIKMENRDKKWGDIFSASMFIGMISAFLGYVFCDFSYRVPGGFLAD